MVSNKEGSRKRSKTPKKCNAISHIWTRVVSTRSETHLYINAKRTHLRGTTQCTELNFFKISDTTYTSLIITNRVLK